MPEITRKELKKLISQKQFDNLYLIWGEEKMYVRADTEGLIEKLVGKEPADFNFHSFSKDYSLDEIAVAVQVAPFVSEYNVVRVADLDISALNKNDLDQLTAIIKNVPDTTILIFSMPTLEQEPKKPGAGFNKVKKLIASNGTVVTINRETDISLVRQLIRWADMRGIKLEQADAYKLQEYVGDDLHTLRNELDKLCNYVGDNGLITSEHIEMLVSKRMEANIFHLTDAIVAGNSTKAFSILDTLFYQRAEPNEIISIISMSYMDFYRARVAAECGVNPNSIAAEFGYGGRAFVLGKANQKTRTLTTAELRHCVDDITKATASLRSERVDGRILLETLVAKLLMYSGVKK